MSKPHKAPKQQRRIEIPARTPGEGSIRLSEAASGEERTHTPGWAACHGERSHNHATDAITEADSENPLMEAVEQNLQKLRSALLSSSRSTLRQHGVKSKTEATVRYALALESHMQIVHGATGTIDTPDDLKAVEEAHDKLHDDLLSRGVPGSP